MKRRIPMHLGDAHPRSSSPDVWVLMFELSMAHTAPPTHCLSPAADHSTRPISPRHRAPPCCRPSTTLRQAEELHRRALTGREDQLGPVHPSTLDSVWYLAVLLETKGSFAEARGISVGIVLLLGAVLLGSGKCGKSGLSSHGLVCRESLHNTVIVLGASSS